MSTGSRMPVKMSSALRTRFARSARRVIVGWLLVSIALYGVTGCLAQMLGNAHVHHQDTAMTSLAEAPITRVAARSNGVGGLEDFRRLGSGAGHGDHGAVHSHDGLERHHHGLEDASVVALDAGASADEGSGASAPHLLATSGSTVLLAPRALAARWPATARPFVGPWIAEGMERPPKG